MARKSHHTDEEKAKILGEIADLVDNGVSRAEACRRVKIPYSLFNSWNLTRSKATKAKTAKKSLGRRKKASLVTKAATGTATLSAEQASTTGHDTLFLFNGDVAKLPKEILNLFETDN